MIFFSVTKIKKISKNNNVFFGIPDVITSSTAPKHLLKADRLTTVSEQGELILEKGRYFISKKIKQVGRKEFDQHWRAQIVYSQCSTCNFSLFRPHKRYQYIHEAMIDKKIKNCHRIYERSYKRSYKS